MPPNEPSKKKDFLKSLAEQFFGPENKNIGLYQLAEKQFRLSFQYHASKKQCYIAAKQNLESFYEAVFSSTSDLEKNLFSEGIMLPQNYLSARQCIQDIIFLEVLCGDVEKADSRMEKLLIEPEKTTQKENYVSDNGISKENACDVLLPYYAQIRDESTLLGLPKSKKRAEELFSAAYDLYIAELKDTLTSALPGDIDRIYFIEKGLKCTRRYWNTQDHDYFVGLLRSDAQLRSFHTPETNEEWALYASLFKNLGRKNDDVETSIIDCLAS